MPQKKPLPPPAPATSRSGGADDGEDDVYGEDEDDDFSDDGDDEDGVGDALGVSVPVWDLPTLALSLRWPSELPLPEQLPLFVSAGFVGVEVLLKAWRWAAKRVGQTTAGEMLARLPCATVSASTRACCTMRKGLRRQRAREVVVGQVQPLQRRTQRRQRGAVQRARELVVAQRDGLQRRARRGQCGQQRAGVAAERVAAQVQRLQRP